MTAIVRAAAVRPAPALESYRDAHQGADVVVCGCGTSLATLADPGRHVTIGVNDVGRLFDPTYLVVVNPPDQLKNGRFEFVKSSNAQALFTHLDLGPVRPPVVHFRLGRFGGTDTTGGRGLHFTQNSPYVAVCLAAHMGARRIGLIGVDLTDDHFFARTGTHALSARLQEIDAQYGRLAAALAGRGVELVNLSPISRLTALPRMRIAPDGTWVGGACPAPSRARRVFFVNYRFLTCGDVFREGLRHGAEELGVESAEADWDDAALPDKVRRFDPDLLFVVHGRKFARRWKRTFADRRTAVWLLDEPYEVDDTASFSPLFTHVFVNDPATLERHPSARYLPACYDPRVHAPGTGERPHRVGFVGGGNAAREMMLAPLARRGLLDYVVGGPWKDAALRRLCRARHLPAAGTAELYAATRIVVNVFRDVHHFNRQRTPAVSLNPRIYEALACGALVVSERRTEMASLVPELPAFEGPEELAALVEGLLSRPDEMEEVRAACARRLQGATYAERLRTVLSVIPEAEAPAAAREAPAGAWDLHPPVEGSEEEGGILVLRKAPDGRPGAERGLASRDPYGTVDLSFEVLITPGSSFIAKVHQQERLDQASNSYHLFFDPSRCYLARHNRVLHMVPLEAGRWERVRITCAGGTLCLYRDGRLACRVEDGLLQGGYAFLGLKGGEVHLRNVAVTRLARAADPVAPALPPAPLAGPERPRVSIVTTVYDRVDCLRRCLRSVKALTFRDYEHIVVSDHPPAAVREAIERVVAEENDGRITYHDLELRSNNWGIGPAAFGLRRSRGEFVCFLSDDNGYRADHLDLLTGALDREPGVGFAYSSCLYGGRLVLCRPVPQHGAIDLGQPLFRRALFSRYLGDDLPFNVAAWDWVMIRELMHRGVRWRHVDEQSFVFRLASYPGLIGGPGADAGGTRLPIFVNNFNRLSSTRALAEWAAGLAGTRVVILDNNSDWPPLLEWYERCPFEVRRLGANLGQRAPWTSGAVAGVTTPFYVVTDPDLDLSACPRDLLDVLADGLTRHPWAVKAGVSLEVDDIPPGYPSRAFILDSEKPYWQDRLDERFFEAAVDTRFALYRMGKEPSGSPALRSDRPYVARHLPWYVTPETLDDEERHYLRSADTRFSSGTGHTRAAYGIAGPPAPAVVRAAAAGAGRVMRRR